MMVHTRVGSSLSHSLVEVCGGLRGQDWQSPWVGGGGARDWTNTNEVVFEVVCVECFGKQVCLLWCYLHVAKKPVEHWL